MKNIDFNDIFHMTKEEINNSKVKLNVWNGEESPLDTYKKDPEYVNVDWFLWKPESGKNFYAVGQVAFNFIQIDYDEWLLTTVKEIKKSNDVYGGVGYEADEVEKYRPFFGRLVINFHKSCRATVVNLCTVIDEFEVLKILPVVYDDDEFPGYENVCLSYFQLETILSRKKSSWLAALRNQKAVYLITDTMTGKQYVGSATSQTGMLLQRWSNYVADGTGGNVGFEELKQEKGFDYIKKNFQYSILENYNARMDDTYILARESWWKNTLKTREFGYNRN